MTIAGEIFATVANMISYHFGYGAKNTVPRSCLYEASDLDFNNMEVVNAYNFLVENGWIFEHAAVHFRKSHSAYNYGKLEPVWSETEIGITPKGWTVANKYLARLGL